MASNSEYEQRRCFENKKIKRIDGGVDGRKTWKIAGISEGGYVRFVPHLFSDAIKNLNIEEKLKTK